MKLWAVVLGLLFAWLFSQVLLQCLGHGHCPAPTILGTPPPD